MDVSVEFQKEYLLVRPELKVHSILEFYSVPKQYLELLEQDMQSYGNLVQTLRTIHCENTESENILLRMETRIDNGWNRYLNYIRECTSQGRIIQMRDTNRKVWYAANMLCLFLTSKRTISEKVQLRRMEFIQAEIDDITDIMKSDGGIPFDAWQSNFILQIHKII